MRTFLRSVHDVVDLLLRRGHLDNRIFNISSMQEGSRIHSTYQKSKGSDYIPEYQLYDSFIFEDFRYEIQGRADGVFNDGNMYCVEEIKSTVSDLNPFIQAHLDWHLGQAKFYAYMLAKKKDLAQVKVILTYIKQGHKNEMINLEYICPYSELESFVLDLMKRYDLYIHRVMRIKQERDESAKLISFPFKEKRKGQQEIIDFVTDAFLEKKSVYLQAPTGIGKTIATLYPALELFKKRKAEKVFYLTSKNEIKEIAFSTVKLFVKQGFKAKVIVFTSKENICFNDRKGHCNPDECPFARNYYDKLYDTIFDSLEQFGSFDKKLIERIAYEKTMCPYQLQIDLSQYCDVLIMDYNYVFDLNDYLSFDSNIDLTKAYLLIDECHNLPDRVREMYTASLSLDDIDAAIKLCIHPAFNSLLNSVLTFKTELQKLVTSEEEISLLDYLPQSFVDSLDSIVTDFKKVLKSDPYLVDDYLLECFYKFSTFYNLNEIVENYEGVGFDICVKKQDGIVKSVKISCLDSRSLIKERTSSFDSTVFFSATLTPRRYYIDLLGGDIEDESSTLFLSSPFPEDNRRVFLNTNISLLYRNREKTVDKVVSLLKTAVKKKKGNYFIYTPSYEYLELLRSKMDFKNCDIYYQERFMSEMERREFLLHFDSNNDQTTIGVLVLGGVFSEGIDLVGDRLIGAIIISVGLPQISYERNRIAEYYDRLDEEERKGFLYAYTYPGLNRIIQAAGRVIRSEDDRGFILFIDSRFRSACNREILNEVYPQIIDCPTSDVLEEELERFYKEREL